MVCRWNFPVVGGFPFSLRYQGYQITDSLRAVEWFQKTQDSSYLEKYTMLDALPGVPHKEEEPVHSQKETKMLAILPDKKYYRNKIHEYHRA